jgi:excisionase family DNA binding protein
MPPNSQIAEMPRNDSNWRNEAATTAGLPAPSRKKPVRRAVMPPDQRLLVDRRNAAQYLSISQRSLDYLLAHGELNVRRIGSRVLIPLSELQRYARIDHRRLVG